MNNTRFIKALSELMACSIVVSMSATSVMASEVKTTSVAMMQQAAINAEEETTSSSGSVSIRTNCT